MTDAPKTLSLDVNEWGALITNNLSRLNTFVQGKAAVTPDDVAAVHQHLDRLKIVVSAWGANSPQPEPQQVTAGVNESVQPAPVTASQANGAVATKKKGGWPKGKPRVRQVRMGMPQ